MTYLLVRRNKPIVLEVLYQIHQGRTAAEAVTLLEGKRKLSKTGSVSELTKQLDREEKQRTEADSHKKIGNAVLAQQIAMHTTPGRQSKRRPTQQPAAPAQQRRRTQQLPHAVGLHSHLAPAPTQQLRSPMQPLAHAPALQYRSPTEDVFRALLCPLPSAAVAAYQLYAQQGQVSAHEQWQASHSMLQTHRTH
jgi:hypothetical protein